MTWVFHILVCIAFECLYSNIAFMYSLFQIHSRVVDNNAGALFDVEVNDLNGDGKQDLLVVSNGNNGSVLAYEIPNDFR